MFKPAVCFFFILLSLCTYVSVGAESEATASLTDVVTDKNRLFKTCLSVNTEVAAFIAILEFDENKVQFREAEALSEDTELSINNSEKGKVTLAFLNEQGTKGDIIKFTFKAISENSSINLTLHQVIDRNGEDIALTTVTGADIKVSANAPNKSDSDKEKADIPKTHTNPTESDTNKGNLNLSVPADKNSDTNILIWVSVAVLILSVGATGFILGKKTNN